MWRKPYDMNNKTWVLPSGAKAVFLTDGWCGGKNCEVMAEKHTPKSTELVKLFSGRATPAINLRMNSK